MTKTYLNAIENDGRWTGKVYEWDGVKLHTTGTTETTYPTRDEAFSAACDLLAKMTAK